MSKAQACVGVQGLREGRKRIKKVIKATFSSLWDGLEMQMRVHI